jgi:hypothetical protein
LLDSGSIFSRPAGLQALTGKDFVMRAVAIALILTVWAWDLGLGTWGTTLHAQDAATWRKVADAMPLGTKVKVQRTDGSRVNGTLIRTDEGGLAIKKNTRLAEAPVTVSYDAIANLERDNGGMHWGKAIGFGAAAGAAAILTIFVIAMQLD